MNKLLTKGQLSVLIVFGVLIIDQIIKILVKTNMFWHESIRITDWFYIYFTWSFHLTHLFVTLIHGILKRTFSWLVH